MIRYWLDFRLCDAQLKEVAGYMHVANHLQLKIFFLSHFTCGKRAEKSGTMYFFVVGISSRALLCFLLPALLKHHATALLN
jgi:hypothetical protein